MNYIILILIYICQTSIKSRSNVMSYVIRFESRQMSCTLRMHSADGCYYLIINTVPLTKRPSVRVKETSKYLHNLRMSSDIISQLHLDKELTSNKIFVAKEINGSDSTFITSCILGHCIKTKHALIVVSTHNSFLHYENVAFKMNYNVQRHVESKLVQFYFLGEVCLVNLLNNDVTLLTNVVQTLKETILQMREKYGSVSIILDGVTHLFDLGYSLVEVNNFCNDIVKLIQEYNDSFILFHCNISSDEDVSHVMANLLAHKADIVLEAESLPSGLSADVGGHLTVKHLGQKFEEAHMFTMDLKPSKYLFKLFDRGVKLFAPGTV